MDLKICSLQGIYIYKKDRGYQGSKYSPWRAKVTPFPVLQKKMTESLRHRQVITIPHANRSYQPRPKATATRRSNLVTLTRPNREKLSHARKVNIGPLPKAKQRTWLATLGAKELETTVSQTGLYQASKSAS